MSDLDDYSDAALTRVVPCPPVSEKGCAAPLGQPCQTARGKVRDTIHVAREQAWSVHRARQQNPDHQLNQQEEVTR